MLMRNGVFLIYELRWRNVNFKAEWGFVNTFKLLLYLAVNIITKNVFNC